MLLIELIIIEFVLRINEVIDTTKKSQTNSLIYKLNE